MVSTIQINAVVLHGINRSVRGENIEPTLSDIAPPLQDGPRLFLQDQIKKALKAGRDIVEDPGLSTFPDTVRGFLRGDEDLLATSRKLARLLQQTQPPQSPEGLLMVADAVLDRQRTFLVAKLEHERGAQAHPHPDEHGRMVFDMTVLDDLIFTTGSRVYKIGAFPEPQDLTQPLAGLVVDHQAQRHFVAKYFRERYLGCTWTERPEVVTEQFLEAAQKWIDTAVSDPERRARYQVALVSELQSQDTGLSVPRFAERHLDRDDRDDFTAKMQESVPMRDLPKSLDYVKARLANVRIDTETGAIVMAPPERMRDGTVTVKDTDDGSSLIQVHDRVKSTSSYGSYRP